MRYSHFGHAIIVVRWTRHQLALQRMRRPNGRVLRKSIIRSTVRE